MSERVRRTSILCWVVALLVAILPSSALATDRWTAPYPGVRHLHRLGDGVDYHVVLIDLTNPQVSLVATRPGDAFTTTSEFARRYDAQIAMNAHFFNHGPCGLAMGGGEIHDRAYEHNCRASIGFGRENEVAVFDSLAIPRGPVPASWMTEVLSGKPFILRDGRPMDNWTGARHMYVPHPRSAIGVTSDRHTLVLLAADGRHRGVMGLSGFQMLQVFREFDVTDAVNLDGGGSTALVVGGRLQNHPADGRENVVASHIGIRIRPGAVWYRAELTGQGAPPTVVQGNEASVWLEARNMGRTTWRAGDEQHSSPRLELDDGVVSYVAAVAQDTAPGAVGRFEVRWLARGAGRRVLRARLVTPEGAVLAAQPVQWELAVERAPRARPVRARAVASGEAPQVVLPAGLGFVRARSCTATPGSRGTTFGLLAVGASAVILHRRRRTRSARTEQQRR